MNIKLIFLFILLPFTLNAAPVQRRIIAFWDSEVDQIVDDCIIHQTLEMPLNHLGLDVIYHDIQKPLPRLEEQDDIRGILISFKEATNMADPEKFIYWLLHGMDLGKKVVLMNHLGFTTNKKGEYTSGVIQNRIFERLGFTNMEEWIAYPYDYQVIESNSELFPFERPLPHPLPEFIRTKAYDPAVHSYLKVGISGKPESTSDLIVIGPKGAYVSHSYANSFDSLSFVSNPRSLGWYFNPFLFFEKAFDTSGLPIPDTTTLAGRRIYIATCHGDSFNSETTIEAYQGKETYVSEVILEEIIKPNPDLPVAVAFVAADFDPAWAAKKKSQEILKNYLATPQVEPASHTYSHPFYWDFFRTGGPEKEMDYLQYYPYGSWENSFLSWFRARAYQLFNPGEFSKRLKWGYFLPRAYANEKFNINKEISGSVNFLNQFASANNKIELLIWSGDSRPWDTPLELCQKAGIKNFGGGYVRFDSEHPSNLFVYPLARKPGGYIQLYAASNAENSYTNAWKDHFYGYKFLPETLKNTESPRRLKPLMLYYHSYSGEFLTSVNAILSNIAYIRTQSPIPIHVGRYCTIGKGFFTTILEPLGSNQWKISNRQGLQTIRFDRTHNQSVAVFQSKGVIGYKNHQNSLYVYLDAIEEEPIISLIDNEHLQIPYLIDSNWEIWDLKRSDNSFDFKALGWGKLTMRWQMAQKGEYIVSAAHLKEKVIETSDKSILTIDLDLPYNNQTQVKIKSK